VPLDLQSILKRLNDSLGASEFSQRPKGALGID
jgi:hypothetical protein